MIALTKGWPQRVDETMTPYFSIRDELTIEGICILWGMSVVISERNY